MGARAIYLVADQLWANQGELIAYGTLNWPDGVRNRQNQPRRALAGSIMSQAGSITCTTCLAFVVRCIVHSPTKRDSKTHDITGEQIFMR